MRGSPWLSACHGRASPGPDRRGHVGAIRSGDRDAAAIRSGDRGAASVWLLAIGLVFVLAGAFGATVGAAAVAAHRAQAAADLAALAGAPYTVVAPETACARASWMAAANAAELTACDIEGFELVATVRVELNVAGSRLPRAATASARAGPIGLGAVPEASRGPSKERSPDWRVSRQNVRDG